MHAGRATPRHRLAPADAVVCVPHQLRLIYKLNFTLAHSRTRHRCWRSHPPPRPTPLPSAGMEGNGWRLWRSSWAKPQTPHSQHGLTAELLWCWWCPPCSGQHQGEGTSRAPGTTATHTCCWHGTASKNACLQLNKVKAHHRVTGFPRKPKGFPRNSGNTQICYMLQ